MAAVSVKRSNTDIDGVYHCKIQWQYRHSVDTDKTEILNLDRQLFEPMGFNNNTKLSRMPDVYIPTFPLSNVLHVYTHPQE